MMQTMLTIEYLIKFLTVMISMILADICWATYFIKVSSKESMKAGIWSMLIILFGAFCTTEYVHDKSLIIAAMLGAFIGSYITVEKSKSNTEK